MKLILSLLLAAGPVVQASAQAPAWAPDLTQQQAYTWHQASSSESTGANYDFRTVNPGETVAVLDVDGPGAVTHLWFTIGGSEPYLLKRVVLRMYWDGEENPSVETPIGDFFGLGTGVYYTWPSEMLSVGNGRALNSFFPMPFRRHTRITVTNEGKMPVSNLYYNIDYRTQPHPLPADTLYFHAQYRQAQPNPGWTNQWYGNGGPLVNYQRNIIGKDNYVWFEAKGHGQCVGVTMSVLQNQDGWWGEGDPMFFIDDATLPVAGTGAEDYFLGAWGLVRPFPTSYMERRRWAPRWQEADRASTDFIWTPRSRLQNIWRSRLSTGMPIIDPITTTQLPTGIRPSRTFSFRHLPAVDDRIPTLQIVGGPGNTPDGQPTTGLSPK